MTPTKKQIQYVIEHIQRQRDSGRDETTVTRIRDTAKNVGAFKGYTNIQARIRTILALPELQATCTLVKSTVLIGDELL